jgi:Protein of unknown function (DUF3987)
MANGRGSDGGAVPPGEVIQLEPPQPLTRELPPADPFPVDALGGILCPAAVAIQDRIRAPLAIAAQSVLATATLAVQAHADVVLPIGSGIGKPVSEFFVTIAATGERKTGCDDQAAWPIARREKALRETYDAELTTYQDARLAWERTREAVARDRKRDYQAKLAALEDLGPAPTPPLQALLICDEPTIEGVWRLARDGQPSLGVLTSEGGRFLGGHAMNDDNRLKTAAALSAIWDGQPWRRVRAGEDASILPGRRLAMHLMLQPGVAGLLFNNPLLADQGLLSRLLTTAPDSAAGTRFYCDEKPETDRNIKRCGAILLGLLETAPPLVSGRRQELAPRPLVLSSQARAQWIRFVDHVERQLTPNGALEPIRGLANKLPEHSARLAAVLTLVRDLDAGAIELAEMQAGIALAEHYSTEALRLCGSSQISADLRLAQTVLDWILTVWVEPVISLPDIYQRGPSGVRDAATAKKTVAILEEHGWLRRIAQGAVVAGQQRRDAWRIRRART